MVLTYAGFGLNNKLHIIMMNKNAPHNIKNIYGSATALNKNSIAGAATNLPKPNPVIASQTFMVFEIT